VTSIQSIEKNLSWAKTSIPEEFWIEVLKLPYSTKDPESEREFTPG
jgi:D-threo-aldose 1-dehydrogenase